ncbi:MAG: hypothetical protein IIB05_10945 [Bacteroidetes bacterium]|nr:hypothetical protein [Bacteroidota bacterium]
MKNLLVIGILMLSTNVTGQVTGTDTTTNEPLNTAENIIAGNISQGVTLGAYAQIDYNQPFGDIVKRNGKLDVHRLVMFMGYKFNDRTHFVSEIEFEHVKELYVEQAFLSYRIDEKLNFKAGLILIPMGIVNEYHEPPTYNGVERPNLDSKIVPTTWRELGAGFSGKFDDLSLKYQLYIFNGFNGYDGSGKFRGTDGFRKGRQKGANSFMSSPNLSTKIDYYGILGLKLGLAIYYGKSQSSLYDGLAMDDVNAVKTADSSVVGITMLGFDARYQNKGFEARAQYILAYASNTGQYNAFTGNDLGSQMTGYYVEAGYDVLRFFKTARNELMVFARYENYYTHAGVEKGTIKNDAYNRTDVTIGLGFKVADGAVFKADYQLFKNADTSVDNTNQFNLGVGIWF